MLRDDLMQIKVCEEIKKNLSLMHGRADNTCRTLHINGFMHEHGRVAVIGCFRLGKTAADQNGRNSGPQEPRRTDQIGTGQPRHHQVRYDDIMAVRHRVECLRRALRIGIGLDPIAVSGQQPARDIQDVFIGIDQQHVLIPNHRAAHGVLFGAESRFGVRNTQTDHTNRLEHVVTQAQKSLGKQGRVEIGKGSRISMSKQVSTLGGAETLNGSTLSCMAFTK